MSDEQQAARPDALAVRIYTAMQMLSLSRSKLYDLMNSGEIATLKVGRARLVIVQSLHDFIDRCGRAG